MNKKYMDFVPTKASDPIKQKQGVAAYKSVPEVKAKKVTRTIAQPQRKVQPQKAVRPQKVAQPRKVAPQPQKMVQPQVAAPGAQPQLGVFENLNQRFVTKDVPKRPLGKGDNVVSNAALKAAKAQNLKDKKLVNGAAPTEKPVENTAKAKEAYKVPKSPFINQEKIVKRPLSKNVYQKEVKEAPKTEPAGPVTVISKPEKDSHVNVIITIIITIVLGAAAGTIAFLLLPK